MRKFSPGYSASSEPKTAVTWLESTPPLPCTSAASATWRSPHSPRSSELSYCLDEEQEPIHPRVVVGESPSVRVHREFSARRDLPRDERATLALLAEPEILQEQHRVYRKRVVQHYDIHIFRPDTRHLLGLRPGFGGARGQVGHL